MIFYCILCVSPVAMDLLSNGPNFFHGVNGLVCRIVIIDGVTEAKAW